MPARRRQCVCAPFAEHDADGRKRAWFAELEGRVRSLAGREADGELEGRDAAPPAYAGFDGGAPFADVTSPDRGAAPTKSGAFEPTPQPKGAAGNFPPFSEAGKSCDDDDDAAGAAAADVDAAATTLFPTPATTPSSVDAASPAAVEQPTTTPSSVDAASPAAVEHACADLAEPTPAKALKDGAIPRVGGLALRRAS